MAQVDAQDYLNLLEESHKLFTWDIEATGLNGDYNSILCVSIKPFGQKPKTFAVKRAGDDRRVVKAAAAELAKAEAWLTYYGKGFDVPMLRARLLRHGLPDLVRRPHVDLYFALRFGIKTSRRSQGHLLSWLQLPEEKMSVSAEDWNRVLSDPRRAMPTMIRRCESDTMGLEALYRRVRHLIREVKR